MISAVAVPRVAGIVRLVVGFAGRERAQPVGGQQPVAAQRDDAFLLIRRQGRMRQADRQDLVRPDRAVIARGAVDYVVKPTGALVGEASKVKTDPFGE